MTYFWYISMELLAQRSSTNRSCAQVYRPEASLTMQLRSPDIIIEHNEVMSTFSLKETLSRFSLAIRLQIECFLKEKTKSDLVKTCYHKVVT